MELRTRLKRSGLALTAAIILLPAAAQAQSPLRTPVSTGVNISGSCLQCDLSNRTMPRISLRGSNFAGSDFSHSNLSGGQFYKSNLSQSNFRKAYLLRVEGENVILRDSVLSDAILTEAELTHSDLSHSDFHRTDLTRGNFFASSFANAEMKNTDAANASFRGADFSGARIDHCDFQGTDFSRANFRKTDFGETNMEGAVLSEANLSGANLQQVMGLTQSQLAAACGDELTKLPAALTVRSCVAEPIAADANKTAAFVAPQPRPPFRGEQAPSIKPRSPFAASSTRRSSPRTDDLDMAIREIDLALSALPANSAARDSLVKSRAHMVRMRGQ